MITPKAKRLTFSGKTTIKWISVIKKNYFTCLFEHIHESWCMILPGWSNMQVRWSSIWSGFLCWANTYDGIIFNNILIRLIHILANYDFHLSVKFPDVNYNNTVHKLSYLRIKPLKPPKKSNQHVFCITYLLSFVIAFYTNKQQGYYFRVFYQALCGTQNISEFIFCPTAQPSSTSFMSLQAKFNLCPLVLIINVTCLSCFLNEFEKWRSHFTTLCLSTHTYI